jgi:amino acid adenylation domain-containing protein/thioester reductase-like protein
VVHPEKCHLLPIGDVGELWLEGPLVGKGYFNDAEKKKASFVQDPPWLLRGGAGHTGRSGRLYRTGDLVRYNWDGSLVFAGRIDTQVKIRGMTTNLAAPLVREKQANSHMTRFTGQRVELAEVEFHIRKCLPEGKEADVVVEAIRPNGTDSTVLVAFLHSKGRGRCAPDDCWDALNEKLAGSLPRYMMPSAYIQMADGLPTTATGKLDRRQLREMGSTMTMEQLAALNPQTRTHRSSPTTAMEKQLQTLWATVLGLDAADISADESFLRLGGDSIRAIQLVGAARKQALSLTVADIFHQPRLCDLAVILDQKAAARKDPIVGTFSLLRHSSPENIQAEAAVACGLDSSQVDDAYPCTPLQAGLIAITTQRAGDYISQSVHELHEDLDSVHFREAWNQVATTASILRTRIVHLENHGMVQVIVQGGLELVTYSDPNVELVAEQEMQDMKSHSILGKPLSRFALVEEPHSRKRFVIWTKHHAAFDAWSKSLILSMVEKAYKSDNLQPAPQFREFVKHIVDMDTAKASEAWHRRLRGVTSPGFPALPSSHHQSRANTTQVHRIQDLQWPSSDITASTLVRVAWALVAAQYLGSDDVVFGSVGTGRDAPIAGIDQIPAPTITTVPLRVHLGSAGPAESVEQLLARVQKENLAMTPFEQMGLAEIRRVSADASQACRFQTLLVVQPAKQDITAPSIVFKAHQEDDEGTFGLDYALTLNCQLQEDGLQVHFSFDSAVLEDAQLRRLGQQLGHVLGQLCVRENWQKKATELTTVSGSDLRQICTWNATVPEPVDVCVHDLLAEVARRQPYADAIHAWDGDLKYGELDMLSTRLARHLVYRGVGGDEIVPLCFEKSMWTPVAMLAVMKAGAASVALDINQTDERLRAIIKQVSPGVLMTSPSNSTLADCLASTGTTVFGMDCLLPEEPPGINLPAVSPTNRLFLVFTSGSTGQPKGVIITHQNFSSALVHQSARLGLGHRARVLDFASYAFDAAWYNLLHTLYAGACLCIPSESERKDNLCGSICRLRPTFANLTPKLAETLSPEALQILELLELGGESAASEAVARLRKFVKVRFAYGPAECSVMSTVSDEDSPPSNIGKGVGVCTWVVDRRNPDALAPVGGIGELYLEGPLVGSGYLHDKTKTEAAFSAAQPWLLPGEGRGGRLYRTGDLVQYNADGSLTFVGRSDGQVKLRGQRIELGEVEQHILRSLDSTKEAKERAQVLADVATLDGRKNPTLVAFLIPARAKSMTEEETQDAVTRLIAGIDDRLSAIVPSYMIPSRYIPLRIVPLTPTGKTDRQRLRSMIKDMPSPLHPVPYSHTSFYSPLTETEGRLRSLWAHILQLNGDEIAPGHSFWQVGGDSITAISLAAALRKDFDVSLPVGKLTRQNSTLRNLANMIEAATDGGEVAEPDAGIDVYSDMAELVRQLSLLSLTTTRLPNSATNTRPSAVFLTGATGYLGTQILCDLIRSQIFDKIVLLVRPIDGQNGLDRVREVAKIAGWWKDSVVSAIEVWEGDLSKAWLGLTAAQWSRLCGRESQGAIDTIIHNGAVVNWSADYSTLKAANVSSTFQLLRAGVQSPVLRRFVYVSGGRTPGDSSKLDPAHDPEATGYVKTKYVAEKLVLAAAEQSMASCGKYCAIRPGLIIGNADSGITNTDDFLWRLTRCCISLGAYPNAPGGMWMPVAEVAYISDIILRQVVAEHAKELLEISVGMPVSTFWKAAGSRLGHAFVPLDVSVWTGLAMEEMVREKEAHPLWPLQQALMNMKGFDLMDPSRNEVTGDAAGFVRRLEKAVARNVQYLKEVGLVSTGGGYQQPVAGKVLMRSRKRRQEDFVPAAETDRAS